MKKPLSVNVSTFAGSGFRVPGSGLFANDIKPLDPNSEPGTRNPELNPFRRFAPTLHRLVATAVALATLSVRAQLAIQGETVYTMDGAPIRDGIVLTTKEGKIKSVGKASSIKVP